MEDLQLKTREVLKKSLKPGKEEWNPTLMLIDLPEKIEQLGKAIVAEERLKNKDHQKSDLTDPLCDILLYLYMIADYYGIDLEKECLKLLDKINKGI